MSAGERRSPNRSGALFCPSVEAKQDRRWYLLEVALEGGVPLAQALRDAARAEAWLNGGLGNDQVLGLDMPFGKLRDPDARPKADRAGGVAPHNKSTGGVAVLYGGDAP